MDRHIIDKQTKINSAAQEAFGFLNINLMFKNGQQKNKVISINSFMPGEGKTTVAINLALAASQAGLKTLLLDADLRKEGNLKKNQDESIRGLTDYPQGGSIKELIRSTSLPNLSYVTSGIKKVDALEFLHSDSYRSFLVNASEQYDLIIIDTPYSGKYPDGAIIASKSSGALLITNPNKTNYRNLERIKWQMQNVNAPIIGVVINQIHRMDYKSYFTYK